MSGPRTVTQQRFRIVATMRIGAAVTREETDWQERNSHELARALERLETKCRSIVNNYRSRWALNDAPATITFETETETTTRVTYVSTRTEQQTEVSL